MGSFSWTRAEATTRRSNITDGDKYKILVPKEFGGGYIKDIYFDCGQVFRSCPAYGCYVDRAGDVHRFEDAADLYGILAYWNRCEPMEYTGIAYPQTMIDILKYGLTDAQHNRCRGIRIGCYSGDIDKLQYPLKLVSASYRGTYESCKGRSYADPNQGFGGYKWTDPDYAEYLGKLKAAELSDELTEAAEPDTRSLKFRDLDKDIAEMKKLSCSSDAETNVLLEEIAQLLEKVRALI